MHTMGSSATIFIATTMFFSCLATAVALNTIYAKYIAEKLNLNEDKFPWVMGATTLIAFVFSLLDFNGIAAFLIPTLQMTYPGLIALTVLGITLKGNYRLKRIFFWGITISMIAYSIYSLYWA
jgi:branched-chain amino acid:cation transporter, LIVCS family